jgi:adenosylcobinamide-GDP ribazoletransferase
MRNIYLAFKFSLSYFSRLPISFEKEDDLSQKSILSGMLLFLPLVGLILGGIVSLLFGLLSSLSWYGATVASVGYMMLYGFIHTEAVIDLFDAIYAAHAGKDPYKVIKEPTVGAIGVLYGVSFLILKLSGMVWLFTHGIMVEFVAVVVISRLSLLILILFHDFNSSFLTQLKEALEYRDLLLLFALFGIVGTIVSLYFIPLLIVGVILSFLLSIYFASKLYFVNGDLLGATLEGVEILLFLLIGILMV